MTLGGTLAISVVRASRMPLISHPVWCSIECQDNIHKTAPSRSGFNQEFANNTATVSKARFLQKIHFQLVSTTEARVWRRGDQAIDQK